MSSASARNPAAGSPLALGSLRSVALHYLQTAPIRVTGPVTGRRYDFSGSLPDQAVDPRDAAVLTRSGLFRRTGP